MWVVIGFIVAALLVGALYYIGWFNEKTHVDTPAGDNVEATYEPEDPSSPSEAAWDNTDGESLDEVITDPPVETQTPPVGE